MATGDEGDEHQMERRLQWEATAHKGQCNEQRGPKATLPEGCKGRRRRTKATQTHTFPLVQSTTLRSEVAIAKAIEEGPGATPSSRRAITRPQGAKSESLSKGLGL